MRYRFGDCVVDADLFELQRGGEPVSLQPKVLGLLLYLLENRHRTVLKEELLEALWADANVGEGSLTRAISLARSALAESGCPSEIIHTVRGRGYRIAVPVEVESLPPASNPSASPREPGSKKEAHEPSGESAPNVVAEAALGREAFERHAWQEAFQHFRAAEASGSLSPEELSTEAHAAWWCGDLEACVEARERAYAVFARSGHYRRAALMAMELARDSYFQLESVVSAAWLKRAERLLEGEGPCIERGYLERMRGTTALRFHADAERALDHAKHAFECATRFGDRDLQVVALHDQGWALVSKGQLADGMLLLDEAAAAAVSGELSPRATAVIYCNMVSVCGQLADYKRAGEWTDAARRWCERQSIAGFPGMCRVQRAEILRLRGAWEEAEQEAERAWQELHQFNLPVAAEALYQAGELRRLRGDTVFGHTSLRCSAPTPPTGAAPVAAGSDAVRDRPHAPAGRGGPSKARPGGRRGARTGGGSLDLRAPGRPS